MNQLKVFIKSDLADVLCVAIPKILGGGSQLALSLILVRFLSPPQFGMFVVCLTSILLLDAVIGSAIDMAIFRLAPIYRESAPLRARPIEKAGLALKPIGSLVLLVPLLLSLSLVSQILFQNSEQGLLLLAAYGALVGLLIFRSMQVHFQIERRFFAYGASDLLHTVARFGGIAILLILDAATPERIFFIYCLAAFTVSGAGLAGWAKPVLQARFSLEAVKEFTGILGWYLPTVIVGSIASRMDLFLVSALGGVAEAGIYGAAQMFALVPQLLGTYASAVFSPRVLPMWREGKLQRDYWRYQLILGATALLFFALAVIGTGPLGSLLLPEIYQPSQGVIVLLLPTGLAAMVNFPLTIPLLLYTHPKVVLGVDLVAIPTATVAAM